MKDSNKHFYSVHDILKFVVIDNKGPINHLFSNFDKHYENFKYNCLSEDCDLIIEIGDFTPKLEESYNVGDGKYYFREDYMYISKEHYKGAKWKFEVEGLKSKKTHVKIDCNTLGRIFITGNVIDFLIHLKLLQKGYTIIHASAVSNKGNAFAFASRGGGGKTTIALELVSKGFSFIGDNYIILHQGTVYSFPTSLSIFTYNLSPIVYDNLSFKEKSELLLKRALYMITGGYAKFFTKINPKKVFDNFDSSSSLCNILLLIPHTNLPQSEIQIENMTFEDLIAQLKYNFMLEFTFFNRYIEEYSYFFPQNDFSLHWNKYCELLKENISESLVFSKIIVPHRYNRSTFSKILAVLDNT